MDTSFLNSEHYNEYCISYTKKHSENSCFNISSISRPKSEEFLSRVESTLSQSFYNTSTHFRRQETDALHFLNPFHRPSKTSGFSIEFSNFNRADTLPGRTINEVDTNKTDFLSANFDSSEKFYVHMGFMFESIVGLFLKCLHPECEIIPQFGTDYRDFTEAPLKRADFAVWNKLNKTLEIYELKFGDNLETRVSALEKFSEPVLRDLKSRFELNEVTFTLLNGSQMELPGTSVRLLFEKIRKDKTPPKTEILKIQNRLIEIYNFIETIYCAQREMFVNFNSGFPYSVASTLSSELKFMSEFMYNLFEEFDSQNPDSIYELDSILKSYQTRLKLRLLSCLNMNKYRMQKLIFSKFKRVIAIDNSAIYEELQNISDSNEKLQNLINIYQLLQISHNHSGTLLIDSHLPLFSCEYTLNEDHQNIVKRLKFLLTQLTSTSGNTTGKFLEKTASFETLKSLNTHSLEEIIRTEYLDKKITLSPERLISERFLIDIVRSFKAGCIEEIALQLKFRTIDPYLSYGFNFNQDGDLIIQTYNIKERVSKLMLAKSKKN